MRCVIKARLLRTTRHTISREQEMSLILSFTPLDLVDLLLNLQGFEVIELWLVRLKFGIELVLAAFFLQTEGNHTEHTEKEKHGKWSISARLDECIVERGQGAGDTDHFVPFKKDDATTLVSCRKIISRRVKFNGGDDIGCEHSE
jgi:hypothetical protein